MLKHPIRLALVLTLALAACKKSNPGNGPEPEGPPREPRPGVVTPVGTRDGLNITSKYIDERGGSVGSLDGIITVTVPPGALTEERDIQIERITNTNPASFGRAFRLKPEGITFAKPVSITFKYEQSDSVYYLPEYLTVAYQAPTGVWMAMPDATVDTEASTITVQTDHFSDWSPVSGAKLRFDNSIIAPNSFANVELVVIDELLAPLTPAGKKPTPLPVYVAMEKKYIKGWELDGHGRLEYDGPRATYYSPQTITGEKEEVTIIAKVRPDLSKPTVVDIKGTITVSYGYCTYRINGGPATTVKLGEAQYGIGSNTRLWRTVTPLAEGEPLILMSWPNGAGKHPFENNPTEFILDDKLRMSYSDYYMIPGVTGIKRSPGYLKVVHKNGCAIGEFVLEKAGELLHKTNTARITGKFMAPLAPGSPQIR